ncbi:MAG: RNase H-like domain-containing protein, partial [Kangiellaceae bacterium]|nr:RNase H-like domain-containing protein [Kangiellaceae bacterium]
MLAFPEISDDPTVKFIVDCDASETRIGAVLAQVQSDGTERPIAYFSRKMKVTEQRYPITRQELLAVVDSLRQFRFFLIGKKFLVRTDHRALTWLLKETQTRGILGRWVERLSEFDFDLMHRSGAKHVNADSLSRRPDEAAQNLSRHGAFPQRDAGLGGQRIAGQEAEGRSACQVEIEAAAQASVTCRRLLQEMMEPPVQRDQLLAAQKTSPDVGEIIERVETGRDRPRFCEIVEYGSEARALVAHWELLRVCNGVLCIDWSQGSKPARAYLPKDLASQVLKDLHDSPIAGHLGRDKTWQRVRERFWCPGLRALVEDYVSNCPTCIIAKRQRQPR